MQTKLIPVSEENTVANKLVDTETDRRIHEHLSNPDDVISEDDIRNIVTDLNKLVIPYDLV